MNAQKSENDLQHFLRLAQAQVQNRKKTEPSRATNVEEMKEKLRQLTLLEELIREQISTPKRGSGHE